MINWLKLNRALTLKLEPNRIHYELDIPPRRCFSTKGVEAALFFEVYDPLVVPELETDFELALQSGRLISKDMTRC